MYKRFLSFFSALVLCAGFTLGSLSFMPKSFAVDDYEFPFSESDLQNLIPSPSSGSFVLAFPFYTSSSPSFYGFSIFTLFPVKSSDTSITLTFNSSRSRLLFNGATSGVRGTVLTWTSRSQSWSTSSVYNSYYFDYTSFGVPFPYFLDSSNLSVNFDGSTPFSFFSYSFLSPYSHSPLFFDFSPFYFPELPHGYFDGSINVVDGQYTIDLGSVTGTTSNTGDTTTFEHYQFNFPSVSSDFDMVHQSAYTTYDGTISTPSQTVTGQTTNAVHYVESGSVDINGSAPVSYHSSFNENSRFRCWSCVMDSSYVWFVSDTRNKITGSIVSVTSDEVTWKYEFADPQGGNTIYPIWAVVFSPMGEVIQVLSPTTASNKNVYTLSCSIGTLEQDQDTGIWSCDPLYHGFWFSDDAPPVQGITSLQVAENKKVLANPVFGEGAFSLNFLNAINENISGLRSDLVSLQSAITGSISNQTSAFHNMDAPSNFDPTDVTNMLEYGSLESDFQAPSTDDIFSISSGTFTDGMGFWRDRMNELLFFSGSPALPMTIFSLTLGLAVLIIGRRVSGGGAA